MDDLSAFGVELSSRTKNCWQNGIANRDRRIESNSRQPGKLVGQKPGANDNRGACRGFS